MPQLGIDRRAVRAAQPSPPGSGTGEIGWAPQLRELIAFDRIAEVLGPEAAAGNLIGIAPEDDRDTVAAVVRDAFGAAHEPLALGARLTTPRPMPSPTPRTTPSPTPRPPSPAPLTAVTSVMPESATTAPPTRP